LQIFGNIPLGLEALSNLEALRVVADADTLSECLPHIPAQLLHLEVKGFVCDEDSVIGLSRLTALRWLSFSAGGSNSVAPTTAWLPLLRKHRQPQLDWIGFGKMIDLNEGEQWDLSEDALLYINQSLQQGSPLPPTPFWRKIRML
jgi:hypothetical protein